MGRIRRSKVNSPPEKEQLGLVGDRRNLCGQRPASSREDIRRGKQRSHKELRRAASEELLWLSGAAEDLRLDETEAGAKSRMVSAKRSSFKTRPDTPLGETTNWQANWRSQTAAGK
jgi:hypothetical protein